MVAVAAALTLLLGTQLTDSTPRHFDVWGCVPPEPGVVVSCPIIPHTLKTMRFRTRARGVARLSARVSVRAPASNSAPASVVLTATVDDETVPVTAPSATLQPGKRTVLRLRGSLRLPRGGHRLRAVIAATGGQGPDEIEVDRVRLSYF